MIVVSEHTSTVPPVERSATPASCMRRAIGDVDRVVDAEPERDRQRDEVEEVDLEAGERAHGDHAERCRRPSPRAPRPRGACVRRRARTMTTRPSAATRGDERAVASGSARARRRTAGCRRRRDARCPARADVHRVAKRMRSRPSRSSNAGPGRTEITRPTRPSRSRSLTASSCGRSAAVIAARSSGGRSASSSSRVRRRAGGSSI